jgi:hypothetical protein
MGVCRSCIRPLPAILSTHTSKHWYHPNRKNGVRKWIVLSNDWEWYVCTSTRMAEVEIAGSASGREQATFIHRAVWNDQNQRVSDTGDQISIHNYWSDHDERRLGIWDYPTLSSSELNPYTTNCSTVPGRSISMGRGTTDSACRFLYYVHIQVEASGCPFVPTASEWTGPVYWWELERSVLGV